MRRIVHPDFYSWFYAHRWGILYSAQQEEASYTDTTTGTVVGYESRMGDADDSFRYFYAPVVRYKTTKGSLCTGIGNVWTSNRPFEVGEQIDIRYNPAQTDVVNVEGYGVSVSYKLGIVFSCLALQYLCSC